VSPALLTALAVGAVLLVGAPGRRARVARPSARGVSPARAGGARRREAGSGGPLRLAGPVLAGVATAVLLGGAGGALGGAIVAAGTFVVLGRLEPAERRALRQALERQAPLVVDLVAACLASGAPLERSLDVASAAVGSPASDVLTRATTALRLGADPYPVWADVARHEPLAAMARALARSQQTGAPLSTLLPRVADQARAAHRTAAEARIRTAAVRLTAPLGVAFLPAFVLLGVVPVVASWVGRLL